MFRGIIFLQLWPVIESVNKADNVGLRAMAGEKKLKLEEEAISETLVADTNLKSDVEASDVEDYFEGKGEEEEPL